MKCRVPRLKSCCCCVDLRAGCFFLALFEIFASILGFFVAEEGKLFLIGRLAYMFHFIGSIFLLMGSMLIETLVIIYLGTNIFHLIFSTAFVVEYAVECRFCALETTPVYITLNLNFPFSCQSLFLAGGLLVLATPSLAERSRIRRVASQRGIFKVYSGTS
ncbi:uncharacterized protein [Drosophila bipectinata]|uniref:uncharacterized protein isoform X2 n=2 Tax=Drosophila bipectinata TaxID=42026 RepID=UPI0038B3E8D4